MGGATVKEDGEALYAEKSKGKYQSSGNQRHRKDSDKNRSQGKEKKTYKHEKG